MSMIFAYFAPEVVMPMASALVVGFGFFMMVGRAPFRFAARTWRSGLRVMKKNKSRELDP
jgi:hypothetical protein